MKMCRAVLLVALLCGATLQKGVLGARQLKDVVCLAGVPCIGTANNDIILGSAGDDIIDGKAGDDGIGGSAGNDFIYGGDGNDAIIGELGNDKIYGENGNDRIDGGLGNDSIDGGDGNDSINGGPGQDTIDGGKGNDAINGGEGKDTILGGDGNDLVTGGPGEDTLIGGPGNDRIDANDQQADLIRPGLNDGPGDFVDADQYDTVVIPKADEPYTITQNGGMSRYTGNGLQYNIRGTSNIIVSDAQGDPHFTGFDGTKFDFHGIDGGFYNLVSEEMHSVNAQFGSYRNADVYNGTWMFGFGMRYGTDFTMMLQLNLIQFNTTKVTDKHGIVRMTPPKGPISSWIEAEINGRDVSKELHQGNLVDSGSSGVTVFFPPESAKHVNEQWDGPIAVVITPSMQFTFYLETEGVLHLDMSSKITSAHVTEMTGVLGQTINWGGKAQEIREPDVEVVGGLLGTDYKNNLFRGAKTGRVLKLKLQDSNFVGREAHT